ncbi:MAG TPA: DUF2231 domain-containing protein, partial [Gemmatimonadales bacterium]|nr:DUF2231 domain-containing protein [Gemmatimonadales bacterium]
MPNIASFHPQIVHFIVVLGFVGVGFRILSLVVKLEWIRPVATLALLAAAVAGVLAVKSGSEAHRPAENIPGAREAVQEHEELGERTRNIFLVVAGFELLALAMAGREKVRRLALVGSALTGVVAAYFLFEAAEHGGAVVYNYAGGVGTRSGDPEHVQNLLVAGLYQAARADREAGDTASAARLTEELARQRPDDPAVQLLAARSLLVDRHDPSAALAALAAMAVPEGNAR